MYNALYGRRRTLAGRSNTGGERALPSTDDT